MSVALYGFVFLRIFRTFSSAMALSLNPGLLCRSSCCCSLCSSPCCGSCCSVAAVLPPIVMKCLFSSLAMSWGWVCSTPSTFSSVGVALLMFFLGTTCCSTCIACFASCFASSSCATMLCFFACLIILCVAFLHCLCFAMFSTVGCCLLL